MAIWAIDDQNNKSEIAADDSVIKIFHFIAILFWTFLFLVHDSISDEAAVFSEPIAAACKIIEQKLVLKDQIVCVVGDGKLGLLVCEVLSAALELKRLVLVGKYEHKMALTTPNVEKFDHSDMTKTLFIDYFDVVIEATGENEALQKHSWFAEFYKREVIYSAIFDYHTWYHKIVHFPLIVKILNWYSAFRTIYCLIAALIFSAGYYSAPIFTIRRIWIVLGRCLLTTRRGVLEKSFYTTQWVLEKSFYF